MMGFIPNGNIYYLILKYIFTNKYYQDHTDAYTHAHLTMIILPPSALGYRAKRLVGFLLACLADWFVAWLLGLLLVCLFGWLLGRFPIWLLGWLIVCLFGCLVVWLAGWLAGWLVCWLAGRLVL